MNIRAGYRRSSPYQKMSTSGVQASSSSSTPSSSNVVLFKAHNARLFAIPPRENARGYVSGSWKLDDCIFTGLLRITEDPLPESAGGGYQASIRLEDVDEGGNMNLFALCPVPYGARQAAVEPACDSSRNFVLKIEDTESKKHAFVGLSFDDRSTAFDFNLCLTEQQKSEERRRLAAISRKELPSTSTTVGKGLSLKEGETLKLALKKPTISSTATKSSKMNPISLDRGPEPRPVEESKVVVASETSKWQKF